MSIRTLRCSNKSDELALVQTLEVRNYMYIVQCIGNKSKHTGHMVQ